MVSAVQLNDGSYITAGHFINSSGNQDIQVIKLFTDGSVDWRKTYGGTSRDQAKSIIPTTDGGFLVTGHTESKGAGGMDLWLLKLNNTGDLEWDKTYGGTENEESYNTAVQTPDGGFLIGFRSYSLESGKFLMSIIKTDANGNFEE